MFTLWSLFKAVLLIFNALTILHRDRFLRPGKKQIKMYLRGALGTKKTTRLLYYASFAAGLHEADSSLGPTSLKNQAAGLLGAVQYMKVPLIGFNALVIAVELVFG